MEINYTSTRDIFIITQGDLIRDFIYYANFYDEPDIILFRGIFKSQLEIIKVDYEGYLKRALDSQLLRKLDNIELNVSINSLNDILTSDDQVVLKEFMLNGYDEYIDEEDENWADYLYEDLDVKMLFDKYLELRNINDGIFISYIYYKVSYIIESIHESLNQIIDDINIAYNFKDVVSSNAEYINFHKNHITENYFKNIQKSIQVYGFFDEKGIYVDKKLTLKNAIQYYQNINNKFQLTEDNYLELDLEAILSYLRYRYFYYKFFNADPDALFDKSKLSLKKNLKRLKMRIQN